MLILTLAAGDASVSELGGRAEGREAFLLAESSRLTEIESRDEGRKEGFAERNRTKRSFHEGTSELAVDTCLCGNESCRLCRSKTIRSAQR